MGKNNKKVNAMLGKHRKLIIFGLVILLSLLSVGYITTYAYTKSQEKRDAKSAQQLDTLLKGIDELRLDNEQLKATLAAPQPSPTPIPVVKKASGCNQNKLDAFKEYAIISGYDEKEIDAYLKVIKADGCRDSSSSSNSNYDTSAIENKLNNIENKQRDIEQYQRNQDTNCIMNGGVPSNGMCL